MLADYLQAAIPTPVTILGQRLHHFSLGLNQLLLRFENSFVRPEATKVTTGDLLFGIYVCCHEYDEALEAIERPDLRKLLRQWGKQIGFFDLKAKAAEFEKYLADGQMIPELLPEDESKSGRTPGAPFLQLVKVTVMGELNYSRHEALNAPLGEVLNDYFAHYEKKGAAKIWGPDEQAHIDNTLELEKEIAKEKGWTLLRGGSRGATSPTKGGRDAV
jgi:hypothetical protein